MLNEFYKRVKSIFSDVYILKIEKSQEESISLLKANVDDAEQPFRFFTQNKPFKGYYEGNCFYIVRSRFVGGVDNSQISCIRVDKIDNIMSKLIVETKLPGFQKLILFIYYTVSLMVSFLLVTFLYNQLIVLLVFGVTILLWGLPILSYQNEIKKVRLELLYIFR